MEGIAIVVSVREMAHTNMNEDSQSTCPCPSTDSLVYYYVVLKGPRPIAAIGLLIIPISYPDKSEHPNFYQRLYHPISRYRRAGYTQRWPYASPII
jgi:hypothetical protein